MKDTTLTLIEALGEIGHSLRNIETVFKGTLEEINHTGDSHLIDVAKDSSIALDKLSKLSRALAQFEEDASQSTQGITHLITKLSDCLKQND
jgi:hypothetical protein